MSGMECQHCGAETEGTVMCNRCKHTASVSLTNIAAYRTDVLRIQPGQRVKVRSTFKSTPPPDPRPAFDPVTIAVCHVDATIVGWVRNLEDDRPNLGQSPTDMGAACAWLEQHLGSIATLEWAGDFIAEVRDCERRLQRLIDNSDTGWYAGICGNEIGREETEDGTDAVTCPRPLYGVQSASWVRCPECGRNWDTASRRQQMMAEARSANLPTRALARVVVGLTDESSEERLTRRIEQWVSRKQLRRVGTKVIDGHPRHVYNIGDVFDLVSGKVKPSDKEAC